MELLATLIKHHGGVYYDASDVSLFNVSECSISLSVDSNSIELKIIGNNKETLQSIFKAVYDLVFVAVGSFLPTAKPVSIDGCSLDTSLYQTKYTTSKNFKRSCFQFLAIDASLIKLTTIEAMMRLNAKPLSTFAYIVSESYEQVIVDHKIALLLQATQGLSNSVRGEDIRIYRSSLHEVFQRFFDVQKSMEKTETILGMLNKDEDGFLKTLVDTRDDTAHYLEQVDKCRPKEHRKEDSIVRQDDYGILSYEYIFCLYIAIRLYLINKVINAEPNMIQLKESMLVIRDWIYKHNCMREGGAIDEGQYKSMSYRSISLKELIHQTKAR